MTLTQLLPGMGLPQWLIFVILIVLPILGKLSPSWGFDIFAYSGSPQSEHYWRRRFQDTGAVLGELPDSCDPKDVHRSLNNALYNMEAARAVRRVGSKFDENLYLTIFLLLLIFFVPFMLVINKSAPNTSLIAVSGYALFVIVIEALWLQLQNINRTRQAMFYLACTFGHLSDVQQRPWQIMTAYNLWRARRINMRKLAKIRIKRQQRRSPIDSIDRNRILSKKSWGIRFEEMLTSTKPSVSAFNLKSDIW